MTEVCYVVSHSDWVFSARMPRMLYGLFNIFCSIGVIWEDNLGCRTESLDINEPKIRNCHWRYFKQRIFASIYRYGAGFHLGREEVFCGALWLYNTVIRYLSTQQRPTFVLTLWGIRNCLFPPFTVDLPCRKIISTLFYSTWTLQTQEYNGNKTSQCDGNAVVI